MFQMIEETSNFLSDTEQNYKVFTEFNPNEFS